MTHADAEHHLPDLASWQDLLDLEPSATALEPAASCLALLVSLIDQARQSFPTAPVSLAPAPDRSNTLLRWRSRQPENRGLRLEIDDPEVVS